MMTTFTQMRRVAGIALCAMAVSVAAAQEKGGSAEPKKAPAADKASAAKGQTKEGIERAKEQATEQREKFLKEFGELQKQLKNATEAQRKEIMEQIKAQRKEFERANSELQKQIRDEQRRQREVPR